MPAETDSGTAVFLVAADDPGVTVTPLETTGLGSVGHLALDGTAVDGSRQVGGGDVVAWLRTHLHPGPQRVSARRARARSAHDSRIRPDP